MEVQKALELLKSFPEYGVVNRRSSKEVITQVVTLLAVALGMREYEVEEIVEADVNFRRLVSMFQELVKIRVDGVFGPQTRGALRDFLYARLNDVPHSVEAPGWLIERAKHFANSALGCVVYGPGHGHYNKESGQWEFTCGPTPAVKSFRSVSSAKDTRPSLHCSALVNMFLGYIVNANDNFTHCGNIPLVWDTLLSDPSNVSYYVDSSGRQIPYRGYGRWMRRIVPTNDESFNTNSEALRYAVTAKTLLSWKSTLPSICAVAIGIKTKNVHVFKHCAILIRDTTDTGTNLYYLGADGSVDKRGGYSADPVSFRKLTARWAQSCENIFQVFGLDPSSIEQKDSRPLLLPSN